MNLDEALLSGPECLLKFYEPVVYNMARSRATQDRATLNEGDLRQIGRMEVLKCLKYLEKNSDIRNFDSFVKSSIRMGIDGEIGKEFCQKRGRFQMAEFKEVYEEEEATCTTPTKAVDAYMNYQEMINGNFTMDMLTEDILGIVPEKHHKVLNALLIKEFEGIKGSPLHKLSSLIQMPIREFAESLSIIQSIIARHKDELFNKKYRCV